jgi:hypothetical protein
MKKIILSLFVLVLLSMAVFAPPFTRWQKQENADNIRCTGEWDTFWVCEYSFDGDYTTPGSVNILNMPAVAYGEYEYYKTRRPRPTSLWQVQVGAALKNYSIPTECWNQDTLRFRASIDTEVGTVGECYKGLGDWKYMFTIQDIMLFEEAMWWDRSRGGEDLKI